MTVVIFLIRIFAVGYLVIEQLADLIQYLLSLLLYRRFGLSPGGYIKWQH